MKKSFFILTAFTACAASILFFSACNKHEGVYKPKQKISKIYHQEIEGEKVSEKKLKETWTWDKKKLTKIVIEEQNRTLKFSYDGDQVSKVESDIMVMNFSYEKKKLDKIEITENGSLSLVITISERDGDDKITKLTYEEQAISKSLIDNECSFTQLNPIINLLFPNAIATSLCSDISGTKSHKAVASTTIYEYTYSGNNISKVKTIKGSSETITQYYYDNKTNPYYKSLYYLKDKQMMGLSENNVTEYFDEDKKMYKTTYELEYNEEDLPISITLVGDVHGATVYKKRQIDYIEYID